MRDTDTCGAIVAKLCIVAMKETGDDVPAAVEVLAKAIQVIMLLNAKPGCERRALMTAQKISNELFEAGIAALDKDLRRMAVGHE